MPRPPQDKPTPKPKAKTKKKEKPTPGPTAQRIIELRTKEKLTQLQMAERLNNLALSSYVRIESGVYRPSVDLLDLIMEKFDVTPYDLLVPPKLSAEKVDFLRKINSGLDKCDERQLRNLMRHADYYKNGDEVAVHFAIKPLD